MKNLTFFISIIERCFHMFFVGEKFNDIKSVCLCDYANFLIDKKDFEKAIKYFKKSITLNPDNFYAYWGHASILTRKKLFAQALEACNKALSIKANVQLVILQSIIYHSLGELIIAEEAFNKTLKYFNNDLSVAYDQLAYTYCFYEMYEEAEYYFKEALKDNPSEAGIHYNLALVYSARKQYRMARDEFQKVLDLSVNKNDYSYKKRAQEEITKITRLKQ